MTVRKLLIAALRSLVAGAALLVLSAAPALAINPAVVSHRPGELDVFARSPVDGSLVTSRWTASSGWSPWTSLGGGLAAEGDIGAISTHEGNVTVFVRGTDDALYEKQWNEGSGWSEYYRLGGVLTGGPTATAWGRDRKDVYVRATNGSLFQKTWTSWGGWQNDWTDLGGQLAVGTGPAANSRANGYVDVAVTGTDRRLYVKSFRPDTGWFPYWATDSWLGSSPGIASQPGGGWSGRQDYTVRASGGAVAQLTWDNGLGPWNDLGGQLNFNNGASPIWWRDRPGGPLRFDVFAYAQNGEIAQRSWLPDSGWGAWTSGPGPWGGTAFLPAGTQCTHAQLPVTSRFGLAISSPTQALGARWPIYSSARECLRQMNRGRPPLLRVIVPIDTVYRDLGELDAFIALAQRSGPGTPVVISPRAATFERCTNPQEIPDIVPLPPCYRPTRAHYYNLFKALKDYVEHPSRLPTSSYDVKYTAWNEPDHSMSALKNNGNYTEAAKRAGVYWYQAASLVGASRVLAGEFSDAGSSRLAEMRSAFLQGIASAGTAHTAKSWALHPYSDFLDGQNFGRTDGFMNSGSVSDKSRWLTEVGALLAVRNPDTGAATTTNLANNPTAQRNSGSRAWSYAAMNATNIAFYLLAPPAAKTDDQFDSAIADRNGRARPFFCGLASLPAAWCTGTAAAQPGSVG